MLASQDKPRPFNDFLSINARDERQRTRHDPLKVYTHNLIPVSLQAHRAAGEERRRRLAISLATLSKKPEKRANVVANGGVAALTKLSRSEESRTRSSCAEVCHECANSHGATAVPSSACSALETLNRRFQGRRPTQDLNICSSKQRWCSVFFTINISSNLSQVETSAAARVE